MRKHFVTGLILLLPIAVTVLLVVFILNLFTRPFIGLFEPLFEPYAWFQKYRPLIHFLLQVALLIGLFFVTVLLGFLARILVFKYFINLYDKIMHRIPIVKTVYKASKQVISTIFESKNRSFKQVVLVPFPTNGGFCIGLVSSPSPSVCEEAAKSTLISVFVPTTPNPTSGYLIMYKKEEVLFLDMKIDEAFKYIISCGVISSNGELH